MYNFDEHFKRYEEHDPKVPVWCLTPNDGFYTHKFFDTIPLSPSGRYLAVFKMPYEHKLSEFGDEAKIIVGFPDKTENALRVDSHVVWDKTGRYCLFNGHTDGGRRIFIADMNKYVGEN